ncbi:hypothetical protein BH24CHL7_BH24CHL7_02360 [soil metagenome]
MVRVILPGPMYQRRLTLRILALLLAAMWVAVGLFVVVGPPAAATFNPVLAACPFLAAAVAGAAAITPGPMDGWVRRRLGVGATAMLLTGGFAILLAGPDIVTGGPLLSLTPGAAYGAALAVAATTLFAVLGWVRGGGRLARASVLASLAAVVSGGGLALAGGGAGGAASGTCAAPGAASSGRVEVVAEALVDGRAIGAVSLSGRRSHDAAEWTGELTGTARPGFAVEYIGRDGRAWLRPHGDAAWSDPVDHPAPSLDAGVVATLGEFASLGAEDLGVEALDGMAARHCRIFIDGNVALEASPPLAWLAGGEPLVTPRTLGVWRGTIDWWTDAASVLVLAKVTVGGLPPDAWDVRGVHGLLRAELRVTERDTPQDIGEPLP